MPLKARNIEDIIRRINALDQRFSEIRDIGQQLLHPRFWRSNDGKLEVGALSEDDNKRLHERIMADLADAELIIAALHTFLE